MVLVSLPCKKLEILRLMYLSMCELRDVIPGLTRYVITTEGTVRQFLPNLLSCRYYVDIGKFFTSTDRFIPKLYDRLEFDIRTGDWYIVKDVST
jgi:hypothetical protein